MKKLYYILFLFFLSASLCSCPYSSAYNVDETPTIYVENDLIGNWMTYINNPKTSGEEAVYLNLSRKTDTEYDISFSGNMNALRSYERIKSDTLTGTAFMSTISGRQFLNININSRVYIAELKLNDNKLNLLPLAEHFTSKMIFNSHELRMSIDFHYKTRVHPVLDEDLCLYNMVKID